jgi:hypothetical protein
MSDAAGASLTKKRAMPVFDSSLPVANRVGGNNRFLATYLQPLTPYSRRICAPSH